MATRYANFDACWLKLKSLLFSPTIQKLHHPTFGGIDCNNFKFKLMLIYYASISLLLYRGLNDDSEQSKKSVRKRVVIIKVA